jgi:hypothetical protein
LFAFSLALEDTADLTTPAIFFLAPPFLKPTPEGRSTTAAKVEGLEKLFPKIGPYDSICKDPNFCHTYMCVYDRLIIFRVKRP